jgi:hypothetical protein
VVEHACQHLGLNGLDTFQNEENYKATSSNKLNDINTMEMQLFTKRHYLYTAAVILFYHFLQSKLCFAFIPARSSCFLFSSSGFDCAVS